MGQAGLYDPTMALNPKPMPRRLDTSLSLNRLGWDPHPTSPLDADLWRGRPLQSNSRNMWLVRDGNAEQPRLEEAGAKEAWQHHRALEHGVKVYVICSVAQQHRQVAIPSSELPPV